MKKLLGGLIFLKEGMKNNQSIVENMRSVDAVEVLDVDSGKDTNRTVVTVIGQPLAVIESAFRGIKVASELINMNKHQGTHPRICY